MSRRSGDDLMAKTRVCCRSFKESVEEKKFIHSKGVDETEWYIPEWYHIYFCPFCGTNIKGKGFGKLDKNLEK